MVLFFGRAEQGASHLTSLSFLLRVANAQHRSGTPVKMVLGKDVVEVQYVGIFQGCVVSALRSIPV